MEILKYVWFSWQRKHVIWKILEYAISGEHTFLLLQFRSSILLWKFQVYGFIEKNTPAFEEGIENVAASYGILEIFIKYLFCWESAFLVGIKTIVVNFLNSKKEFRKKYLFLVSIEAVGASYGISEILFYGIFWEYAFLLLQLLSQNILKKFKNFWVYRKICVCRAYRGSCSLVRKFGNSKICLVFCLQRKRVSGGNRCNRS